MFFDDICQCGIFAGVDPEYLRALIKTCDIKDFSEGEEVFNEGEPGLGMYVILEGEVTVSIGSTEQPGKVLAVLDANHCFGEVGLISKKERIASMKVTKPSKLLYITTKNFHERIENNEIGALRISHNIALTLVDRIRRANELIAELQQEDQFSVGQTEISKFKDKLLSEILL